MGKLSIITASLVLIICLCLVSCEGVKVIKNGDAGVKIVKTIDKTVEEIRKSDTYRFIVQKPWMSTGILTLIAWVILIIIIHFPIKKAVLSNGTEKRVNFIKILHDVLRLKTGKSRRLLNWIITLGVMPIFSYTVIRLFIEIIPPALPLTEREKKIKEPEHKIVMKSFETIPKIEEGKGDVLFSENPIYKVTGYHEGNLENCMISLFYSTPNAEGNFIAGSGEKDLCLEGRIEKGKAPEKDEKGYPWFEAEFWPEKPSGLFCPDLKGPARKNKEKEKSSLLPQKNIIYITANYAPKETWASIEDGEREKFNLIKTGNLSVNELPKLTERYCDFYCVYEVPFSEQILIDNIWSKASGRWVIDPETGFMFGTTGNESDARIQFKNDGDMIPYPFGIRFKLKIDPEKERPSALGLCIGNLKPTFVQIKIQSLKGEEDKFKFVVAEEGKIVDEEWAHDAEGRKTGFPIKWDNLDVCLYAYKGGKVLFALEDGKHKTFVYTYEVKDTTFKKRDGSRFTFLFEGYGSEVSIENVYVFHFDEDSMGFFSA